MLRAANNKTDDWQLAQDAVQRTFIKVIKIIDTIDEQSERRTGGLLCKMVRQAVYELYHEKKRCVGEQSVDNDGVQLAGASGDPLEELAKRDAPETLKRMLSGLQENYATLLLLRYGYDMSNEEIATAMGISINTVYVWMSRGKQKLKNMLMKGGTPE